MEKELNQVQEENTDLEFEFSDFTDDEEENTEEVKESENIVEEKASTEETKKLDSEDLLEIIYNGEKKQVSKEEAITLAQKGMNYDKVVNQLQDLKNSPELQIISNLAKANGMDPVAYVQNLQEYQFKSQVSTVAKQLKEKNPEASEDLILDYAQKLVKENMQENESKQYALQELAKKQEEEKVLNDLAAFQNEYPDVNIAELPSEVVNKIRAGESLLSAYRGYEINQIRKENEILKQNKKNEEKSVGSLSSNQAKTEETDGFLQGLMSK